MDICISSQNTNGDGDGDGGGGGGIRWPLTARVILADGQLQEFKQPILAKNIVPQNPNCFLCSSEFMSIGSCVPQVTDEEELQEGQIYFLMPLSRVNTPLSLQDLCAMAVNVSATLGRHDAVKLSSIKINQM